MTIIPVSAEDMERANALPSIDLGHIFTRATGDSSGGGLSGGAIFGIVAGVIALIGIIATLVYCSRRQTPFAAPAFPFGNRSAKPFPAHVEQGYLPRYTGPTQAYIPPQVAQMPPVVYPSRADSTYYVQNQVPHGVRFGEVGVRRF